MSKGYIYIGVDHSRLFKIGIAKNPDSRARQIQIGNPTFKIFMRFKSVNPRKIESDLHNKFIDKRVTGEWYSLSAEDITYIAENYANKNLDSGAKILLHKTLEGNDDPPLGEYVKRLTNHLFGVFE